MATENIIMAMVKAGGNRQVQMQCLKYLCSWPGVCLLRNKGSWALVLSHLSLLLTCSHRVICTALVLQSQALLSEGRALVEISIFCQEHCVFRLIWLALLEKRETYFYV